MSLRQHRLVPATSLAQALKLLQAIVQAVHLERAVAAAIRMESIDLEDVYHRNSREEKEGRQVYIQMNQKTPTFL